MEYEIVELEEKIVEGISIKTTNENGKSIKDISNMWQSFFEDGIYQNIENRVVKVITKGKYAKFVINGDVQKSVGEAWSKIWNMNLNRKYTCDFEEYQNNSEDVNNQEIHIYIAIED